VSYKDAFCLLKTISCMYVANCGPFFMRMAWVIPQLAKSFSCYPCSCMIVFCNLIIPSQEYFMYSAILLNRNYLGNFFLLEILAS